MDRDLLVVRWASFVALVVIATLYMFPRIEAEAVGLIPVGILIVLAAGLAAVSLEAGLRYLAHRMAPAGRQAEVVRGRETAALRRLHSATAQQQLPELLEDLLDTLRPAVTVDRAWIWLPDGLPGGPALPVQLPRSSAGENAGQAAPAPGFLAGIWQTVSASSEPVAIENLTFGPSRSRPALIAIPLAWRDQPPLGLLLLAGDHALLLDDHQLSFAQTLAGEAALLVQNARLMARVEFQAMMEERARLAREIHDGLAQTLAFLKIQAAQMQYFLQHGRLDRLEDTLAASRDTLGEAYQEARRAIEDLRLLPATSTVDWLLRLADDFRSTSGLQVEAAVSELRYELAPSVQAQLIRIVQEAFANIRRHSQAHRVTLSVVETEDALVIEIGDDGLGIDSLEEGAETHYGLVGMRERAELIGGELRVQGRQAGGTSVRLQLPLDPRLEK